MTLTTLALLPALTLFSLLAAPLSVAAQNQHSQFIYFEVPGADTAPGDYNGTFPSGINDWGAITGYYEDANNEVHGFLRVPGGKFITFDVPGAVTMPGSNSGTTPSSINDLGQITGSYSDVNGSVHGFLRGAEGNSPASMYPAPAGSPIPSLLILRGPSLGITWTRVLCSTPFYADRMVRSQGSVVRTRAMPAAQRGVMDRLRSALLCSEQAPEATRTTAVTLSATASCVIPAVS